MKYEVCSFLSAKCLATIVGFILADAALMMYLLMKLEVPLEEVFPLAREIPDLDVGAIS